MNLPSRLDHFKLLGRSGLRVSPLCLGTVTFGRDWGWGSEKDEARRVFDCYADRGGNFIDTANFYTGGTSEIWLGEFLEGRRDRFVLGSKYSINFQPGQNVNAGGNQRKSMRLSVESSLKRLRTDYLDLFWLHSWEGRTPLDEIMRGLDDLVISGKVLHVAVSDTPAWIISQANMMADLRGWSPFIALQLEYNLLERTPERDLVPMARALNIAVMPWSPLAGGLLSGKYTRDDMNESRRTGEPIQGGERRARRSAVDWRMTEQNFSIVDELLAVSREIGRPPTQVAIRWLIDQPGVACPILGARTVAQLEDNLAALEFRLDADHLRRLDEVSRIEPGFPHDYLAREKVKDYMTGGFTVEERA